MKTLTKSTVSIMVFLLILASGCATQSLSQLRQKYPLYERTNTETSEYAPFDARVKVCDDAVYATVTSDVKILSLKNTESAVNDKAFEDKNQSSDTIDIYVYSVAINETVAGLEIEKEMWIYARARDMENYLIPQKGQRYFFLLMNRKDDFAQRISIEEGFSKMPVHFGAPLYYITDAEKVLSIENSSDMKSLDLSSQSVFSAKVKDLWNEAHK